MRDDAMYEVTTRTTYPYSAICYVVCTWADGYSARGSGTVVGPNDILTALHVVYNANRGGWATSITVYPGADTSPFSAPYGSFTNWGRVNGRTTNWDTNGDGLLSDAEAQYDLALIGMRLMPSIVAMPPVQPVLTSQHCTPPLAMRSLRRLP